MKCIYTTNLQPILNEDELKPYNYDTRYEALKAGFTCVHLFESNIVNGQVQYTYYSTMFL